jgi:hypothetical protein
LRRGPRLTAYGCSRGLLRLDDVEASKGTGVADDSRASTRAISVEPEVPLRSTVRGQPEAAIRFITNDAVMDAVARTFA